MAKLLFLDCDGTIRQPASGKKFIDNPQDQCAIPGADKAIANYHQQGYLCIGVTNQGGVASGYKSLEDTIAEQSHTLKLFPELEIIYFCPDYEGQICWKVTRDGERKIFDADGNFRKPGTGMLLLAASEFEGILAESTMAGDRPEDEAAAMAAGVTFLWADVWRKSTSV
ncbi:HAD-IIIA family hydrolase [Oscillatoriales cyanobacterium LEGE 11467]|uniref:D,D-heptose 1,7-bisphosphate phosphatase n=1 Tax=Zarconia navalis LEGE 11467 TaxID=1828826 RepID=A0A928VTY1_9CYAN|nr:HAD-IIIA family hydrolase [Zarconia navalis]MBE9039344.1 HAD-IIIA family hydrolase [Zarconia navalis LEGE 11467]